MSPRTGSGLRRTDMVEEGKEKEKKMAEIERAINENRNSESS